MKRIEFFAGRNRSDDLLHIETDGAVINIRVGLHDSDGRQVTSVEVLPDDESRGGDGYGYMWDTPDGPIGGRLVRRPKLGERGKPATFRGQDDGRVTVLDSDGNPVEYDLPRDVAERDYPAYNWL